MIRSEKSISYLAIGAAFLILTAVLYMFVRVMPDAPDSPRFALMIWCAFSALSGFACLAASALNRTHGDQT
jgi:hypothetical protein